MQCGATCFVIVASVIHGLKLSPIQALVTVFIYLPDHVLNFSLQHQLKNTLLSTCIQLR